MNLRKRVIVPLGPTEDPETLLPTLEPAVGQLTDGIRLVRVEPDYWRGVWFAVLDVTDAPGQHETSWWAPGLPAPMVVSREHFDAVASANQTSAALNAVLANRPKLELLR